MIEVVEQPDSNTVDQVRSYLDRAGEQASGEHDPRWLSVLAQGLGHRPYMLISRRNGDMSASADGPNRRTTAAGQQSEINGYLPLALVSSWLFGRFLVSLPYLNRAGLVAQNEATASALINEAVMLADKLNVKYLELRHGEPTAHQLLDRNRADKVRMVLSLPNSADDLWDSYSAKVRNQIRKGDKHNLAIQWGGEPCLDAFFTVFAHNMRDLGTPVYPRKFFSMLLANLGDDAELGVVSHEGESVAAALLVHTRAAESGDCGRESASTQVPSASALRDSNTMCANMWMYHQLLCRAVEKGSKEFDFGRSSEGSGTYRFKKQWGATPHSTVWQYHLRDGDAEEMRPDSPKYRRRIELWQKLPVWVTRMVGPAIVRGIP